MMTCRNSWNQDIAQLPGANFLQTSEWAAVKAQVGWEKEELTWKDEDGKLTAAAMLLTRSTRLLKVGPRMNIDYIPRGPLMDWTNQPLVARVIADLEQTARARELVFLKIDPEVLIRMDSEKATDNPHEVQELLTARGWRCSPEQIQFKNTMLLHLDGEESDWLTRMKQKTRYNLRLAQKNGILVRKATMKDLPLLYRMFAETARRDNFIIRSEAYYLDVWSRFMQAGMAEGLIAEFAGQPIAGMVLMFFGSRAWFVYGMSTSQHREKMPNYLLQWEAMRLAREKGCTTYDLWGAPDTPDPSDPMFGVYRFKEGLGAELVYTIGAWDFPLKPALYRLYHHVIPRVLSITRYVRRKKLTQEVI